MTEFLIFVAGAAMGLFVGLWSSNKYHETMTKDRVRAGNFQFRGKAYHVHEMEGGDQ